MANPRSPLILTVYAPALTVDDSRPLAVVRGMERALPGLRLEWTIPSEGKLIQLPQREAWLAKGRPTGRGFPLICNGDESYRVTLSGWERPAGISPGGLAQFEAHAKLPLDALRIAAAADVLESMGEATRAFWGHATPESGAAEMAQQTRHSVREPHVPPRGLPPLKRTEEIRLPEIPARLGWLNYWSDAAARAIGFPDPGPRRGVALTGAAHRDGRALKGRQPPQGWLHHSDRGSQLLPSTLDEGEAGLGEQAE
jgi:Family of unknown function (DUF5953)